MDLGWGPLVAAAGDTDITPQGPAIDVFNFGGGRCQTLPPTPPRGPTIDIFNFSGSRCRTLPPAPPMGPTINVFKFGGGRCRTCRQHP
jgi:hypothetical protein